MNKVALAAYVVKLVGRSGYTSEIDTSLNLALEEIGQRHDFKGMLSFPTAVTITVATNASYATIPTGYLRLKSVCIFRDPSVYHVDIKTKQWTYREYPSLLYSRYVGYEDAGKFYFRPDPVSGDTALFGISTAPAWTASGGDFTQPISGIDRALVAFAASQMFEQLEIPVSAERWGARFELALRRAISSDMRQSLLQKPTFARTTSSEIEELLGDWPDSLEA